MQSFEEDFVEENPSHWSSWSMFEASKGVHTMLNDPGAIHDETKLLAYVSVSGATLQYSDGLT